MKKLALLILFLSLLPLGNAGQSVYTCDTCHSHAKVYKKHLEGEKYCYNCHEDVHVIHKFNCESCHEVKPFVLLCHSAPSNAKIPVGKYSPCGYCHENLVETHKGNCQACHREDVNKIHWRANIFGGD
ncbi:MAG: hypothetical protein NZ895_03910 [Archaeoglobaceae archaeon]|nr:hypothetical protein [Archaeoglobaceae archaeon]MCX8152454.1 hypothetical protein [Archaeoglobaceae archaeon]MDW8013794.1 hypothetical protein [Archaeoglobaceae archaeon]